MTSDNQDYRDYKDKNLSLILASNSPRRKELLGWLDIPFEVLGSNIEENSNHTNPKNYALDLASQKGESVWESLKQRKGFGSDYHPVVISSDTIVVLGERILEKPFDREHARQMLKELSGKEHEVITSVFIKTEAAQSSFAIHTKVKFAEITDDIMEPYLDSKESMDKAGAYGIQGKGLLFVESIQGSYSNVVGFPLSDFVSEFKKTLGVSEGEDHWREMFRGVTENA